MLTLALMKESGGKRDLEESSRGIWRNTRRPAASASAPSKGDEDDAGDKAGESTNLEESSEALRQRTETSVKETATRDAAELSSAAVHHGTDR